ncbi:MAG: hypothetical protein A3J63_01365 [Candidatus Moranbacteria bacterium RIFCSPHIGHO2_02_FULL_40_12b]|nr:MAG: hypothetical protein A3J63_01365 [Candidatus Moranbacteria bacterium RIFCSPHIGHO2_02_FULL_40_12b]OGI22745.1 MAG: hypothetical protein A3E91_02585 [Candidatus Moranbacteria bacterium RIFCSPHIGHO2_12_FULL_40_10]
MEFSRNALVDYYPFRYFTTELIPEVINIEQTPAEATARHVTKKKSGALVISAVGLPATATIAEIIITIESHIPRDILVSPLLRFLSIFPPFFKELLLNYST